MVRDAPPLSAIRWTGRVITGGHEEKPKKERKDRLESVPAAVMLSKPDEKYVVRDKILQNVNDI